MELVTSCKNSEELNRIRKCIAEQVVGYPVYFSSYRIIGTETQRLNIETDDFLSDDEKNIIKDIFKSINCDHNFLFCGFDLPINQLKNMNKEYNKILNYKNLYFFEKDAISEELVMFAKDFLKQFTYSHKKIDINSGYIRYILGLRPLGLTNILIEYENGRLYLQDMGEEHRMDNQQMCQYIYNKMTESDQDVYYDIEDEMDQINVKRLKSGITPVMSVEDLGNFQKFKIMLSFCKLCSEENYPMFNPVDIHELFESNYGYNYYTLKFGKRLEEEFEEFEINYYKEHEYYNIEEALAFTIYLSGLNIKHFLFENKVLKSFTVCYSYVDLLEPYPSYKDMKGRVISLYKDITGYEGEHIHGRYFHDMSLKKLLNCFIIDNTIIFRDQDIEHINPITHSPLPICYYDCIKYRSDGLYNIYDITKGIFSHYPVFDREELEVRDVNVSIQDEKIIIHGVIVAHMEFENKKLAHKHICKCWKKGYFLNTFGLNYYMETGEISVNCIKRPVWFSFNNSNEKNLYEFLEFNNL